MSRTRSADSRSVLKHAAEGSTEMADPNESGTESAVPSVGAPPTREEKAKAELAEALTKLEQAVRRARGRRSGSSRFADGLEGLASAADRFFDKWGWP